MKVIMVGGGTAGHVSPILAVIEELKKEDIKTDILFVGSMDGVESKLIPQTETRFLTIRCGKFRRYHSNIILNIIDPTTIIKNIIGLKNFIAGIFDAMRILGEEDPDVIFLKGGYVSLPMGIACRIKRYPYFIHESDIIFGMANKMLAKKAQKVFVSYPLEKYRNIKKDKLIYSGNPIREDILGGSREEARKIFSLKKDLKTILVIGGSQGAHSINTLISKKLESYLEKYQLIHIAGDYSYEMLEERAKKVYNRDRYKLYNFITKDLQHAYAVCDIVISRAGNNVLSEISALGKPAVIIPIENSANNHQFENAKIYSRDGAAYMMLQKHLTPEKLFKQVDSILENPEEIAYLSEKIHKFYKKDATEVIAKNIIKYYKGTLEKDEKK